MNKTYALWNATTNSSVLSLYEKEALNFQGTSSSWIQSTNSTTPNDSFGFSSQNIVLTDPTIQSLTGVTTSSSGNLLADETEEMSVLAIIAQNALTKETISETLTDIYFYYSLPSAISLNSNRYYALSYYVLTSATGTVDASVRLGGSLDFNSTPLNTNNTWELHYIFFATATTGSPSMNISLQLGNKTTIDPNNYADMENKINGYILFDNLSVYELSEYEFCAHKIGDTTVNSNYEIYDDREMIALPNSNATNFNEMNVYEHFEEEKGVDGGTFDKTSAEYLSAYWYYYTAENLKTAIAKNYLNAYNATDDGSGDKTYFDYSIETENTITALGGGNNFTENNKVLKVVNNSAIYNLGFISKSTFTIEQHKLYRVSVWVRSTNRNANATLIVLGKIPTGNDEDGTTYSRI